MGPHLEGKPAGDARALHSGQGAHALEHAVVEDLDRGRHHVHVLGSLVEVARAPEQDVGAEQVARVEPGQLLLLAHEGPHHQARAHEQDHRQPDLRHQQRGPAALARPAAPAPSFLEDVVEIDARRAQRGQEAEDQAGGHGNDEGEREHAHVDVHVAQQLREAGGDDEGEEARPPEREQEAAAAPDEGQHEVLREELPHETAAAGPVAARSASSFCRAAPAASSRFATLAQAMSRTKLTAPSRKVRMFSAPPKKAFWMGTTRAPFFPGFSPRASST
jgi:hypothetical protein